MMAHFKISITLIGVFFFLPLKAWMTTNKTLSRRRLSLSLSDWVHQIHDRCPPYLALITEPDACDSEERMAATLEAIQSAVSTQLVTLVSVRISKPKDTLLENLIKLRVKQLTGKIVDLTKGKNCHVVVTSDWVSTVDSAQVGIHVKESQREMIPRIRNSLGPHVLIGTSAHSVESALEAVTNYQPDYMFVGTCYATASHPEKGLADLEGPQLPGQEALMILTATSQSSGTERTALR